MSKDWRLREFRRARTRREAGRELFVSIEEHPNKDFRLPQAKRRVVVGGFARKHPESHRLG